MHEGLSTNSDHYISMVEVGGIIFILAASVRASLSFHYNPRYMLFFSIEEIFYLYKKHNTVKLLNNGLPEEQPLINNYQILIALAYFNTFATLKGGQP